MTQCGHMCCVTVALLKLQQQRAHPLPPAAPAVFPESEDLLHVLRRLLRQHG